MGVGGLGCLSWGSPKQGIALRTRDPRRTLILIALNVMRLPNEKMIWDGDGDGDGGDGCSDAGDGG